MTRIAVSTPRGAIVAKVTISTIFAELSTFLLVSELAVVVVESSGLIVVVVVVAGVFVVEIGVDFV